MRQSEIYFVALPPAVLGIARQAAHLAFPGSRIVTVDDWEEVAQVQRTDGAQLLVLADDTAVAAATASTNIGGLPRWAVVVLGRDSSELAETVTPEEWNPPLLARVFRSALLQHELLCENLRLQGDLRTVARRISHDLRTPVGCIHTSSDVLAELDPDAVAVMAAVIKESSTEISRIIDRVSYVLKASTDPSPLAPVAMGDAVAAALRQLEPEIEKTGAQVAQPDSWPEVTGVGSWLQVIWCNLLGNALQHGGAARPIRIAWKATSGGYHFSVTDSGPGILPAREAALFQSFDQLHLLPAPGLGLPITQRLVALQGGRCGHERPAAGGAAFFFTLPARAVVQ